jgi:hypothetical protein
VIIEAGADRQAHRRGCRDCHPYVCAVGDRWYHDFGISIAVKKSLGGAYSGLPSRIQLRFVTRFRYQRQKERDLDRPNLDTYLQAEGGPAIPLRSVVIRDLKTHKVID